MAQVGGAVIDQQEGTEGELRGWPGRSVLFAGPLLGRTYSPPARGLRWYCLTAAVRSPGGAPCRYIPADANGGLCVERSRANALGGLGAFGHQQAAPGYIPVQCLLPLLSTFKVYVLVDENGHRGRLDCNPTVI